MAKFISRREALRANWQHFPKSQTLVNAPGKGKLKRREIISFDVQLHEGKGMHSKRAALINVKVKAQSVTFTSYGEHAATSHRKGPQIMGNRGKALIKPKRFKRWGSK